MKKKDVIKWGTVVCLVTLVSLTSLMGSKESFAPQTLENIKALAEESGAEFVLCAEGGDLICPFQGIRVYDYINYWSLTE